MEQNLQEYNSKQNLLAWSERIRACRESGMSVREWCSSNGIPLSTYMVMFLETDLKYAKKFDETTLSPVQKAIYQKISEAEKEKVRQGYGVSVVDLETGDTICEFNRDTYRPPKRAIEELARALLPEIVEFYKDENNRKEFEEWKKDQEKK